jgi:hypothetical protein
MAEIGGDAGWLMGHFEPVSDSLRRTALARTGKLQCTSCTMFVALAQSEPGHHRAGHRRFHATTSTALGKACGSPQMIHLVGQTEAHAGASSLPCLSLQRSHFTGLYVSWLNCIASCVQACTPLAPHMMPLPLLHGQLFREPSLDLLKAPHALSRVQTRHLTMWRGVVSLYLGMGDGLQYLVSTQATQPEILALEIAVDGYCRLPRRSPCPQRIPHYTAGTCLRWLNLARNAPQAPDRDTVEILSRSVPRPEPRSSLPDAETGPCR